MQDDLFRTRWKKFRNEIHFYWSEFSSDEVEGIDGRGPQSLVFLLQSRYGYTKARAEREVERVLSEFEDKLKRAS